MTRSISTSVATQKNKVSSTSAWAFLYEVQVSDSEALRVTDYNADISYDGETYYAYPIERGAVVLDSESSLNTLTVTVSNVGLIVMSYLESGSLIGKNVRVTLINLASTAVADSVSDDLEILSATADMEKAVLTLGMTNLLGMPFPRERSLRTRCRYLREYGGGRCGYNTSLPNLVAATYPDFDPTTCDGTRDAENGCRVHGENEVANGMARQHPRRFGGFPGIPKGSLR